MKTGKERKQKRKSQGFFGPLDTLGGFLRKMYPSDSIHQESRMLRHLMGIKSKNNARKVRRHGRPAETVVRFRTLARHRED